MWPLAAAAVVFVFVFVVVVQKEIRTDGLTDVVDIVVVVV